MALIWNQNYLTVMKPIRNIKKSFFRLSVNTERDLSAVKGVMSSTKLHRFGFSAFKKISIMTITNR